MEPTSTKEKDDQEKTCLQNPHTLRLLKLIHEGTPKFASLAVDRLPTDASADVLWDLIGRLQAILTSAEWKTRQAAARAMEKLGEQLNPEEFLNQDDDELSLQYVVDNMSTIVSQSPLYGSSQSRYDLEEESIKEEDVAARIQRQRELLARRLGLDSIGTVLGSDQTKVLPLANDDFVPPSKKRAKKCPVADDAILLETSNPFTALLVRQSQVGDNALKLLTTELVFRMFHPSWWMRHGAILGLISLTKAFSKFGSWTEAVLSRALCVLALDRFGDFAGDTVAPVRETAAQLVATILHTAPMRVRGVCVAALLQMVSSSHSWELQHGAMSAMKFIFTLKWSDDSAAFRSQARSMIDAAILRLENTAADDVVAAAAGVLMESNEIVWRAANPLWSALKSANQCSSSVVPLVTLLKRMAMYDSTKFADIIGEDPDSLLLDLLCSPFESVRVSALEVVGAISSCEEIILAVFELHYDSGMPRSIVEKSWESLSSRCCSLSAWRSLLDRYFCCEYQTDVDGFPLRPATALSMMYKPTFSILTHVYVIAMIQSPWIEQCENSLLLYGSLQEFEWTGFSSFVSAEGNILCLSIGNGPALSRLVPLRNRLTKECFDTLLLDANRADEMGRSLGLKLTALSQNFDTKPTALQIMRVKTGVAGALVSKGLLPKAVTQLVRALVTSFNNESENCRRHHTADCLYNFIRMSNGKNLHEKAITKIVNMICDLASSDAAATSNRIQRHSAVRILRSFASLVKDIPPLWKRLSPLLLPRTNVDERISAVWIINAVTKGFALSSVDSASGFVQTFVGPLIDMAPVPSALSLISDTLCALCELEPEHVLGAAVPKLTGLISEKRGLTEYCQLLHDLVKVSEASIGPYIRDILPRVMALITDRRCSTVANSIFATLVRCAPLVTRKEDSLEAGVIDHLIFGEPLPPCRLPARVQNSMKTSRIVLRNYQLEGISWLQFLRKVNISGALCDDMGLGKTLQALLGVALAHAEYGDAKKSLVVCPSTLVLHWEQEIYKYFPCRQLFRVLPLIGSPGERAELLRNKLPSSNVVITSYSVLRSDIDKLNCIFPSSWCYCILDEGHLLKNPQTATAKAAKKIVARHKLILSGTPIQNRVQELWAVFDFLMPNFLGDLKSFEKKFARPIAKGNIDGASAAAIAEGIEVLKLLHQTVLPFILRREKSQVLPELPAMTETVVKVSMSSIQRRIYESFCRENQELSHTNTAERHLEEAESSTQTNMFKSLLFLRLVCTHPRLVLANGLVETHDELSKISASGKLSALVELLNEAGILNSELYGADNDSSLLYCEDGIGTNGKEGYRKVIARVSGDVESFSPLSTAFPTVHRKVSKCLIFAQFAKTLDLVEDLILRSPSMKSRYVRLCGKTPSAKRMSVCKMFQEQDDVRVMILATRVGGLGLNLTAADRVIFIESDYNPQVDIQAIDRTRRIGQKKVVHVYKLVTENSVEEAILHLQAQKLKIAEAVVSTENSSIFSMGTDRLLDIFTARTSDSNKEITDLDGMLESCIEDYKSLSASFFEAGMKK